MPLLGGAVLDDERTGATELLGPVEIGTITTGELLGPVDRETTTLLKEDGITVGETTEMLTDLGPEEVSDGEVLGATTLLELEVGRAELNVIDSVD